MLRPLLLVSAIVTIAGSACARPIVVTREPARAVVVTQPRAAKVPPGHFPPPGQCRLWYPGRPPGKQPPPTRCNELRGAAGSGAFILYNSKAWDADYDWRVRDRTNPGSVPAVIVQLSSRR